MGRGPHFGRDQLQQLRICCVQGNQTEYERRLTADPCGDAWVHPAASMRINTLGDDFVANMGGGGRRAGHGSRPFPRRVDGS